MEGLRPDIERWREEEAYHKESEVQDSMIPVSDSSAFNTPPVINLLSESTSTGVPATPSTLISSQFHSALSQTDQIEPFETV